MRKSIASESDAAFFFFVFLNDSDSLLCLPTSAASAKDTKIFGCKTEEK